MFSPSKGKVGTPDKNVLTLVTETERNLYQYYTTERNERLKLESLVKDLQNQIGILQEQLKCLAENSSTRTAPAEMETSNRAAQYSTDEEDLARETEWIRIKSRKKRKLNTSPTQDSPISDQNTIKEKCKKNPLPPPIVVDGVKNYQKLFDFLSQHVSAETFNIKMLNGDTVKINATNDESYRNITKALSDTECLWHSYENKQDRPIRVMAKKLHSTCQPERITEDLQNKGYKILEAVNKLSWRTKEPLNMFMLTFSHDEEINKIHNIKTILGCKIEIQALKSTKLVPQCKRCQAYGHTQKYCSKEPRCVKCTGKHLTKDCTKPKDQKPKCVHCGGSHPANYRGCTIAKEIQLIRNRRTTSNKVHQQTPQIKKPDSTGEKKPSVVSAKLADKNISYAQVAGNGTDKKLDDILKYMLSFNERLQKIENSAKNAKTKQKQ